MFYSGSYHYGFWEADPKKWERCKRQAFSEMIASGWKPYARKFEDVMKKKALKLWRKK